MPPSKPPVPATMAAALPSLRKRYGLSPRRLRKVRADHPGPCRLHPAGGSSDRGGRQRSCEGRHSANPETGVALAKKLDARREDMIAIASGSDEILDTAIQAERAAMEAQRGAELVASAAEQQSAASAEAQTAIQQQAQALEQSQTAAQALAVQTEQLRRERPVRQPRRKSAPAPRSFPPRSRKCRAPRPKSWPPSVRSTRGSQQQAAATQQTSAALAQIERSAGLAKGNAGQAVEQGFGSGKCVARGSRSGRTNDRRSQLPHSKPPGPASRHWLALNRSAAASKRSSTLSALVAVQTTMLAVSGSVEAARAGDAGRGFALVSGDIRGLARETSDNVDRIKDTVRGITGPDRGPAP